MGQVTQKYDPVSKAAIGLINVNQLDHKSRHRGRRAAVHGAFASLCSPALPHLVLGTFKFFSKLRWSYGVEEALG